MRKNNNKTLFSDVRYSMDSKGRVLVPDKFKNDDAGVLSSLHKMDDSVKFTEDVLKHFRKNVGRLRAETGGMLASSRDEKIIDRCYFDVHSNNTSGSFYYDVESMSVIYREWKAKGYITNGIYHSHPLGITRPSYHDISSALLHMDFFGLEYFYLPIFQPERRGNYTMYFYVVKKNEYNLTVTLNYVVKATQHGFHFAPFNEWKREYPIEQLLSYRESVDGRMSIEENKNSEMKYGNKRSDNNEHHDAMKESVKETTVDSAVKDMQGEGTTEREVNPRELFVKVKDLYPDSVLDKVIVCVGTGGARSFLENMARSGFRNFLLMDADIVSPSNIATQNVFVSEIGKKKVEVIRDRIKDINPLANVVCVEKFLDDTMSDEEFQSYLNLFSGKSSKDYLILGCTDNFKAQKRSSLLALKYGIPYLAAMMYEGGAAAEIIFVYPGVTESCPRCLLRDRFEKYENGFVNDVDSSGCPIFATERMNALKGYISLMLLMYKENKDSPFNTMLDDVKDRNFVEIRLAPYLKESKLNIGLFDKVFADASRYVYFDETLWVPQHPDRPEFGVESCKLCGGSGKLEDLQLKWKNTDTRTL